MEFKGRLLIIADDFTGALDTGVQFAARGIATRVITNPGCDFSAMRNVQVLVIDTETRHLSAQAAYESVSAAVRNAKAFGFDLLYKKTDSALRGNVGAELAAVLAATGEDSLAFLPAFPQMNRVTRDGIAYINGVPVSESIFGSDPFEPVRDSHVPTLIARQTAIPVTLHTVGEAGICHTGGIHVYDAASVEDLMNAGLRLKSNNQLRLLAGCAGMASVLPDLIGLEGGAIPAPVLHGKLLTLCGSVNPITRAQLDAAEAAGALRLALTPSQKLTEDWAFSAAGRDTIAGWMDRIEGSPNAIVECGSNDEASSEYARQLGLTLDETRRRIARNMGGVLIQLLDMGLKRDILITGGDTLLAFMTLLGCDMLTPLCEIRPGVVLTDVERKGERLSLMTKSGGFGARDLLTDLADAQ